MTMFLDDGETHISLGSPYVIAGDKVAIHRQVCEQAARNQRCADRIVAEGSVTKVLSDKYSVARFPSGVDVREGDEVRKVQ